MNYEVLKPFNSVNRRFEPGSGPGGEISDGEDVAPLTFEILKQRKFIQPKQGAIAISPKEAEVALTPTRTPRATRLDADDK